MAGKNRREIGTAYEKRAVLFLREQGYDILQTNFRCRQGEIDIVARDGRYLVFVEVKYRGDDTRGLPEEAVGGKKQKKIIQTARYYLYSRGLPEDTPCRFDVVAIHGKASFDKIPCVEPSSRDIPQEEKISLIRNAFES